MTSLNIKLQKNEELTPEFLDIFSKLIINNSDFFLGQHLQGDIMYRQFQEYLCKSSQIKHNGLKSPVLKSNRSYTFNFESKSNNLVFLLDLSPYMLIYNYGTRSFPLKNLQEIVIYLFRKLSERQQQNRDCQYKITIYLFSIYKKELQLVILNDFINENSFELLSAFINKTIQKSNLPYEKQSRKENLKEIFQKMFNNEETNIGIKTIIIISSFHQEESGPFLLFTPNWYTYGFITTGGHFGSYIIDNQQIESKVMAGNYFKTKYIFKAKFLENWEMTDRVKKYEPPQKARSVQSANRCLLFERQGKMQEDIFNFLLRFQVVFKEAKKSKISGGQSAISTMKDSSSKIVYKTYKIAGDSFIYILRTKYVQGWEPIVLNFTSIVQNSKFKLRLHINNNSYIYYQAIRSQNNFIITIFQNNPGVNAGVKDVSNSDKIEIANTIEKMDKINSYNFINLLNQNVKLKELKSNTKSSILLFHNNEYQIVNDLCKEVGEWGKYFKIKRISFRFTPAITSLALQQFVNQISFILGKKISKFIFVKQSESEKKSERIDEIESSNRRVMFSKIEIFGNIVGLELAFLRFIYKDITAVIEQLSNKLHNRKFKWGVIQKVPNRLVDYFKDTTLVQHPLFHRKWVFKAKNKHYKRLFDIYWEEILKKTCYEKINLKNNQSLQKNYYKIIQIKTEYSNVSQKVVFLKVRESHQKDAQIMMHLAMPPCLMNIYPYFKEQEKVKPINLSELVGVISLQLKKTQQEIIKLIDSYQAIHIKLIKAAMNSHPKLFSHCLEKQNSELYDIKINHFRYILSIQCKEILSRYYRQDYKEIVKSLPIPNKLLMNTQFDHIQGDINITLEGRQYYFFMCTPYTFIYLYRKDNSIFYKVVSLYYEEYNVKQSQNTFLQKIIMEITKKINQQIYCQDFRVFLQGNFKGGIAKIINNKQYTRTQSNKVQLQPLFSIAQKHTHNITMQPNSIEYARLRKSIEFFKTKLFLLIHEFFPLLRINYYFQIRKDKHSPPPFVIDTERSRLNTEVFMRVTFNTDEEEGVDITPNNLTDFIMKHFHEILKNKSFLFFRFYLQVKNHSENESTFLFIDYFTELIDSLIKDFSFQIQRVLIIKKDVAFDELGFLQDSTSIEIVKLQLIKQEQSQSPQNLCRYIESNAMQHYWRLLRIKQSPAEFILVGEQQQRFLIEKLMVMRVTSSTQVQFVYRPSIFFQEEQRDSKKKIHEYLQKLNNYINASKLVQELKNTQQLPLQPYELYLNKSANDPSNKIVAIKKKKVTKNPVTKYLRRNPMAQQIATTTSTPKNVNRMQSNKQIPLNLIYRNYVPLNKRISNNQGLQALKEDQIFTINAIQNLKNTYLFYCEKNYLIIHFEEKQDENIICEIAKENNTFPHKCKKYLLYYVFCLDPLARREIIEKNIYEIVKQAINRKLFDEVSDYLLIQSDVIEEDEEYFIRGGGSKKESKQSKFDLPARFHKDQLVRYLSQHIEVYHFKVQFKSQLQRSLQFRTQLGISEYKSIRIEQKSNESTTIFPQFTLGLSRNYSMNENNPSPYASTLQRPRNSNMSFTKQVDSSLSFQQEIPLSSSTIMSIGGSNMAKAGDNLYPQGQPQSFYKYEYIDSSWLFNSASPKYGFAQAYGKCLYLLKLKVREQTKDKPSNGSKQPLQLPQFKKHLLKKNTVKPTKRDSVFRPSLCFEITDYVGTIKFTQIQDTFAYIMKAALAEYYIQNYFQQQNNLQISMVESFYKTDQSQKKSQQPKPTQCSKGMTQETNKFTIDDVYHNLLEWKDQLQEIMQNVNSLAFFKYRSYSILAKDITTYFDHFFNEFKACLKDASKRSALSQVYFLVYAEMNDQTFVFWKLQFNQAYEIKHKIQPFSIDQIHKLGFILSDYFDEVNDRIQREVSKKVTSHKADKLNHLKYFLNLPKKDEGNVGQFRRSLFASYQINYEYFYYQSYNLNPQVEKELEDYLKAMDCWLSMKNKLYKFIKNVKEKNVYEVSNNPAIDKKTNPFYKIREYSVGKEGKQQFEHHHHKSSIKMQRLLLNLIFQDFPMAIPKDNSQGQTQIGSKMGKQAVKQIKPARIQYIHHCTQANQMLQVLQSNPINYNNYKQYKGTEKFPLEKLGREYFSILRKEYISPK